VKWHATARQKEGDKKMSGIAAGIGVGATIVSVLRELLEAAGVDREKIVGIIEELRRRLKIRSSAVQADLEMWEYSVVTLGRKGSWRRSRVLTAKLRDGVEIPEMELAHYLNQLSSEGWEVLSSPGEGVVPTIILVRSKTIAQ
jgi:hypothetical protein